MKIITDMAKARTLLSRSPRAGSESVRQEKAVRKIVDDVRARGGCACRVHGRFDGVEREKLEVDAGEMEQAWRQIGRPALRALEMAARAHRFFHIKQKQILLAR
jgi:histidinol dehydrogenase